MPLVIVKRQSVASEQCPTGYSFYTCNNARVVWTGCCSLDPCNTGCPAGSQPDAATQTSSSSTSMATESADHSSRTAEATSVFAPDSTNTASSITSSPSDAKTTSSSSPSTSLGESTLPSGVTADPSTQTLMDNNDGNGEISSSSSSGSDVPAIIGASVGALVLAALISLLFFCYRRRKFRARQRGRHETIPYKAEKRHLDIDGPARDSSNLDLDSLDPRSQSQPPLGTNHGGAAHLNVMSSPHSIAGSDSRPISGINELPTTTPLGQPSISSYERASQPASPAPSNLTNYSNQAGRVPRVNNVSLPQNDPMSWSQFSYPTGFDQDRTKQPPDLGQEHRVSRATGATFTPAPDATTAPSIKITPAKGTQL